jgi:hypothetical protein
MIWAQHQRAEREQEQELARLKESNGTPEE